MSNRNYDVTSLGELLIDFTENGTSAQGNPIMEANPGGAPCNVLAMLERLGKKTAFIGKVGKDMFGNQLKAAVEEVGIDTRALIMDEEVHTTLAFVHTYPVPFAVGTANTMISGLSGTTEFATIGCCSRISCGSV